MRETVDAWPLGSRGNLMSHDTILTDKADVRYSRDNIRTAGWLSGHISGLNAAAEFLRSEAVTLFRNGEDERATKLRRLAEEMVKKLRPDMEKRCEDHKVTNPEVIEAE
jgi:hypothetical protein